MKNITVKLLLLVIIIGSVQIKLTNSFFNDTKTLVGNTLTAGCWSPPEIPQLIYPANGYLAGPTSGWYLNPYQDWSDSWVCPGKSLTYQYESYLDASLTHLAYRSGPLTNSRIPAPGTPDGSYYWRVRAFDGDNWSGWSSVWLLIVDTMGPTKPANLHFDDPSLSCGSYTNIGTVTVDWDNSYDVSGVAGYDYHINYPLPAGGRADWYQFFTSSLYRGTLNEGLHTVRVRAKDNAGNYSGWSTLCDITYDTTLPSVPTGLIWQSTDRLTNYACGGSAEIQALIPNWDDNTGDATFSHYEYTSFWPNGNIGLNENVLYSSEFVNSWVSPIDGTFGYAVRAVDMAGNKSNWALSDKTLAGSCQINLTLPAGPNLEGVPSAD